METNTKIMSDNNLQPTMLLTTSKWAGLDSFCLIPIDNNCPYVEALYNPAAKTLAIIGRLKKDAFHMVPRLNDEGKKQMIKGTKEPKQQRVQQESYAEYYITKKEEIENFIEKFAINHKEFDYQKTLDMEMMEDPDKIITGPTLIT